MTATRSIRSDLPALPVVVLVISFALPPETSLSLGSLRLSPYRITLILLLLPALGKVLSNRHTPFGAVDALMAMHSVWAGISLVVNMGLSGGGETAGIYVIETFGAYIVARAYITDLEAFTRVLKLVFLVVATLFVFAAAESLSGFHILREPFKAVMGGAGPHYIEPRLGLTRAFASFEHPILFGVFAAGGFAGTYFVLCEAQLNKETIKKLGVVAGATFFSLSGGPYTALALQIGLIAWDKITLGIAGRWYMLAGLFGAAWAVVTLMSNRSPLLVFISYLTFSANSAYNRVHIWNYGTAEVARHPIFGLGLNDWIRAPWMSSSMDNYWLLTTMRYGIPAAAFLIIAAFMIVGKHHQSTLGNKRLHQARKAWMITFIGYFLAGLTVHFWNSLMVQFFFFIGCGMALVSLKQGASSANAAANTKKYVLVKRRQLSWISA